MDSAFLFSVIIESAIILACIIFSMLLMVTKVLPPKVSRNGVLLFINLGFIAFFYLSINLNLFSIAKAFVWLFVPSAFTIGLFFYRFNTLWLQVKSRLDGLMMWLPIVVLLLCGIIEILVLSEVAGVRGFRIMFIRFNLLVLFPIYSLGVMVLNFVKLSKVEQANAQIFAANHMVNLKSSRISLGFFGLFLVGMILSELVSEFISEFLFNTSILMLTLYLGYYQIRVIAQYLKSNHIEQQVEHENEKSPEISEKGNVLFEQLEAIVDQEQLFLNLDLSIHQLAERMDTNAKYLSQAINQQEGLNFNKFINLKRIEYACVIMKEAAFENYSIEGVAKESGFRSKSTFNTTFKTIKGCTPSEFRKN